MVANNCLLIVLMISCITTDLLYGKILNSVVLSAAAAGIVLHVYHEGVQEIAASFIAAGIVVMLLYPFWYMTGGKGIGAGDIKLLAAIGIILPEEVLLTIIAVTFGSALACGLVRILLGKGNGMHLAVFAALGTLLHIGGLY